MHLSIAAHLSVLFITFLLCIKSTLQAQSVYNSDFSEDIDDYVQALRNCKGIPAMTVSVVQGEDLLHSKAYGYLNSATKEPALDNSRFCVASLTKAFTATLLAILLDETGHDWDTPIVKLMGGVIFPDPYRTQEITLRDILSHKVGYPMYDYLWISENMTPDEMIRRLRYVEPVRTFRTGFTYTNIMYILAGKVAERLGRRSWELLLRERIFEPLQMNDTGFAWEAEIRPDIFAKPHMVNPETEEDEPLPIKAITEITASLGAASICTSARDMAKWMVFVLNRQTSHIIKNTPLLEEMFDAQTALPLESWNLHTFRPLFPPGKYLDYGLGWFTGTCRGYQFYDHYGYISTYFSMISIFPQQQVAVFSSVNGFGNAPSGVAPTFLNHYILDRLMNETVWMNATQACDYTVEERSPPGVYGSWQFTSMIPFDPYVGSFGHPVFGNISIYVNQSTDELNMKYGSLKFTLEVDEEADDEGRFTMKPQTFWQAPCGPDPSLRFLQFSPYDDGEKSNMVSIPCFETGLADMNFERDLKLSDIEVYTPETKPRLNVACVRSKSSKPSARQVDVVLSLLLCFYRFRDYFLVS